MYVYYEKWQIDWIYNNNKCSDQKEKQHSISSKCAREYEYVIAMQEPKFSAAAAFPVIVIFIFQSNGPGFLSTYWQTKVSAEKKVNKKYDKRKLEKN